MSPQTSDYTTIRLYYKNISMNYITIVIMPRSEKLVTVVSLGISEAGPRDMGEYECQVSFTNKISRQTIAH